MSARTDAFWRNRLDLFINKLEREDQEELALIIANYGAFRSCRAIEEDIEEILESPLEILTKGL